MSGLFLLMIAGLIAYLVLAGTFILAAWGANSRAKWLGLAALAAGAPGFVWMGTFAEKFDLGQCYSEVVRTIAKAVEKTDSPRALAEKIRTLPMRGYETNCSEVEAAAHELPNASQR
jgi:hypothetical protein